MTREIPLTKGQVALVDDEDYELVSAYKWQAVPSRQTWYARTAVSTGTIPRQRYIYMHHLILPVSDGLQRDHEDGDGLNNQRHNLRPATQQQNAFNRRLRTDNSSGFKGVHFDRGRWIARISVDGKRHSVGSYDTPEDGAAAYNDAALTHYGEFARLNPGV